MKLGRLKLPACQNWTSTSAHFFFTYLMLFGLSLTALPFCGCGNSDSPSPNPQSPNPQSPNPQSPNPQSSTSKKKIVSASKNSSSKSQPKKQLSSLDIAIQNKVQSKPQSKTRRATGTPQKTSQPKTKLQEKSSEPNSTIGQNLLPEVISPLYAIDTQANPPEDHGLRVLESNHLRLITDHPKGSPIDQFPEVFDQATKQWLEYFQIPRQKFANWKVEAFVMVDESKFAKANYLPKLKVPPGGLNQRCQIWIRVSPGDYYTRHLLLHEGTHAFCWFHYRRYGPAWLSEGLAEHLAVHRWDGKKLQLAARIKESEKLAYWGRIKILKKDAAGGKGRSIQDVLATGLDQFPNIPSYAWAWAMANFLDSHPDIQQPFRNHLGDLIKGKLSPKEFMNSLPPSLDPVNLQIDWTVLIHNIEYGIDPADLVTEFESSSGKGSKDPFRKETPFQKEVSVKGNWIEIGTFEKGDWQTEATGRFQIEKDSSGQWESTADGVTLEYYQGRPVGKLLAAWIPVEIETEKISETVQKAFGNPKSLGSKGSIRLDRTSRLFLKINDHPLKLNTNAGKIQLKVFQKQ